MGCYHACPARERATYGGRCEDCWARDISRCYFGRRYYASSHGLTGARRSGDSIGRRRLVDLDDLLLSLREASRREDGAQRL